MFVINVNIKMQQSQLKGSDNNKKAGIILKVVINIKEVVIKFINVVIKLSVY